MARPRVFVSSTFYDLKQIRADIERFIKGLGYEPVLAERGHVPYEKKEALDIYCYREISKADIVVVIIGGRSGSQSSESESSIVEKELESARKEGKHTYIFIDQNVDTEYGVWSKNKSVEGFKPNYADSIKVYTFVEKVKALNSGNPTFSFNSAQDIIDLLQEQFAGLFKNFLDSDMSIKQLSVVSELRTLLTTTESLVSSVESASKASSESISEFVAINHPACRRLRTLLPAKHNIVFRSFGEMSEYLVAYGYQKQYDPFLDEDVVDFKHEWAKMLNDGRRKKVFISALLFDKKGSLIPMGANETVDELMYQEIYKEPDPDDYDPFGDE